MICFTGDEVNDARIAILAWFACGVVGTFCELLSAVRGRHPQGEALTCAARTSPGLFLSVLAFCVALGPIQLGTVLGPMLILALTPRPSPPPVIPSDPRACTRCHCPIDEASPEIVARYGRVLAWTYEGKLYHPTCSPPGASQVVEPPSEYPPS